MVARVVRIENKKLPMKDATKGMQVIGLGDGAVACFHGGKIGTRGPINAGTNK